MSGPISGTPHPSRLLGLALGAALLGSLIPIETAAATATLTVPANTNVSADLTGSASGQVVGNIVITGSGPGDIGAGTLTLSVTGPFALVAGQGTATITGAGCDTLAISATLSVTASGGTVSTTGSSSGVCAFTVSGLRVVPTSGAITSTGTLALTGLANGNGTLTEVSGAATSAKLTFTQQPSSATTGGSSIGTVQVTDLDQFNNPRTGALVSLSIASSVPPLGGALTCGSATTNPSGVATFTGCTINKAPATYTLRAIDGGIQSATISNQIVVSVGSPTALSFTTYPGTNATTSLGNVVVAVVDAGGNTVTGTIGTVSLTSSSNGTTFTCGGLTSPTAALSSGVATFSNCIQTVANVTYTLTATMASPSLTKTGTTFTITSGPATKLAFCWGSVCSSTVPVATTGGMVFAVQPVIVLQDVNGNTVTSNSTAIVYLAITNTATGATLTCTSGLTRMLSAGTAAFSGCSIDKVGTYQLTATSNPVYTPATSGTFVVSAGPPVKLTLTSQPTSGTASQPFATQPVVAITDAGGNVATTSSATITLSLTSYTSGSVLTCTSGLSRTTVSGVATFSGCSINAAGTNYVITATATNVYPVTTLAAVSGNAFTVTAPTAQVTLAPSATVITWSKPVTVTAQFGLNGNGKALVLQTSTDQVNWTNTANLTANSAGTATFTWTPARNLYYRAVFAGAADLSAANSNVTRVVVRQIALLRPLVSGVRTIARGSKVTFTTTVRPARPELPKAKVTFTFVLKRGSTIVYSGKRDVYINAAGQASWTWTFSSPGEWYVRAIADPTTANANSVWSSLQHYHVG